MHETYCTPSAPSRRGVLAGTGFAGIATAQLFAAQAGAAGTSATVIGSNAPSAMRLTKTTISPSSCRPFARTVPNKKCALVFLKSSGLMARNREFLPPGARAGKNSRSDF